MTNKLRPLLLAFLSLVAVSLALLGCATPQTGFKAADPAARAREEQRQKETYVRDSLERQIRLKRISTPLLESAAGLKEKIPTKPLVGVYASNAYLFPLQYREIARGVLGDSDAFTVQYVVPGSPADEAMVKLGDALLSINGAPFPRKNRVGPYNAFWNRHMRVGEEASLAVLRDGAVAELKITPGESAAYDVFYQPSAVVNAYADGSRVFVTSGIMDLMDDKGLAVIVGHEIAHNAMGHIKAKVVNSLLTGVLDVAAAAYGVNTGGEFSKLGANLYSQEFEKEADYVGVYIAARAGLDVSEAASVWRKMARENPSAIKSYAAASHPGTAERYVLLEEATREIHEKQSAGLSLVPDYVKKKGGKSDAAEAEPSDEAGGSLTNEELAYYARTVYGFDCVEIVGVGEVSEDGYFLINCSNGEWLRVYPQEGSHPLITKVE